MPMRDLHRVARLRDRHLDARSRDPRIGDGREDGGNSELGEVALPEGETVERGHRARETDAELAGRRHRERVEQLVTEGEEVVDHRLASGGGGLAELVG